MSSTTKTRRRGREQDRYYSSLPALRILWLVPNLLWLDLDVGVAKRHDIARIGLRIRPGIHHGCGSTKAGVFTGALRTLLPLPPEAVNVRVMHPEDRIRRGGRDRTHRT